MSELGLGAFVTAVINHDDLGSRLGLERYDEGALVVCGGGGGDEAEPRGRLSALGSV